jgi:tRNA 2-thiouridine synthesizing protein C
MGSHFFLFQDALTAERLGWIDECLKFFFVKLHPENLLHATKSRDAVFTFFLTGDSLYSLQRPETQQIWEIILSLSSVNIICDSQELALRGISVERLRMKNPDQVILHNSLALNGQPSFWKDVMALARQHRQPVPSLVGFLHLASPYMNRSSAALLDCLSAALEAHASIDLYCYLDGVHVGHHDQKPSEFENIGEGLAGIAERAAKRGLQCQMLACSRCASARGYSTWDDGQGAVVSTCTIKPFRIRNLNETLEQFRRSHIILAASCASIQLKKEGLQATFSVLDRERSPPLTILISTHPYGTESAFGGLSLAIAAAYQGIMTRVVFIEDGVYALHGSHRLDKPTPFFNLQEVIDAVTGSENLQLYCFTPSLQKRGITKNPKMIGVLDIGIPEFGNLLFYSPSGNAAGHQRVLFF